MNGIKRDSNMRGTYKALIAAMWLSPLYIAFRYWQVGDQLPARMVTHFGANGPPNGWMTPQESLTFSLVLSGMVLLLFTAILAYASRRMHALNTTGWALMGFFYVIGAVITVICDSVLRYNLSQNSVPVTVIGVAIFLSMFILLVIFLRAQRGAVLPASETTQLIAGIRCAVTGFAASGPAAPSFGATLAFASSFQMEKSL